MAFLTVSNTFFPCELPYSYSCMSTLSASQRRSATTHDMLLHIRASYMKSLEAAVASQADLMETKAGLAAEVARLQAEIASRLLDRERERGRSEKL